MTANSWVVEVQQDPKTKELTLPLPVDALAQMGWSEGTELFWEIKEGKWTVREANNESSSK